MDTGSHLLFGATLAGLAYLDPHVAANPTLASAILVTTLISSHAPDLDTLARLKGYANYIRHHRGITHSLSAMLIWPMLIGLSTGLVFHVIDHWGSLIFWSMIAIMLHVLLDLLNAYGVQSFRPFSAKWVHLDILALFEPILFALHAIGLGIWFVTGINPGVLFMSIYLLSILYIGIRAYQHHLLVRRVYTVLGHQGICHVVPSLHCFRWQFVLESEYYFYTGIIRFQNIIVQDLYRKDDSNQIIQATMGTDGVRAFLHFAQRVHVSFTEKHDGYEVKWRDLRFWYDHKLPFGVDVHLDRNLNVTSDFLGWSKKAWDPPYV
jgi:inner membrane protein